MKLEHVVWIDSMRHSAGWQSARWYRDELTTDDLRHETVGWAFHEDEDSISLCMSRAVNGDEDRNVTEVLQIPKTAILERHELLRK